jgi:D-lactate dehydrogenase
LPPPAASSPQPPGPARDVANLSPQLLDALRRFVAPDQVLARDVDRIAFASDASFYRLVPRAVVLARSIDDVRAVYRFSREHGLPMTFRAAGTSLSGQAVTDGLLVEVARHWRHLVVEHEGDRVRVQPGVIGGHVNAALARYAARIGPDPASINTCTIGGILANNSSGMCCGVSENAYHTLESLTFVLPSGTTIDTARPDADGLFRQQEPRLAEGLLALKRGIERNPALRERIRAKYRTKNTTGYSLNAFLDWSRPVDIMRHLLIGSEGTLGFIAEAVLRTLPALPVRYTGLLLFPNLHAACASIVPLAAAGARALELMDRASLRSVEHQPGVPAALRGLPGGAAGLLAEFQVRDEAARPSLVEAARAGTAGLTLLEAPAFTHEPSEQLRLWTVRQGLFPSVGAVRRSGTTVIIEDVAFPVEALADAAVDLTRLFAKHDYPNAIIFGHAKDGNLHFVLTQSFNTQTAIDQYARFMDDVVSLVVERYDGALKAEHGTGRNMAPFVEAEWGPEATAIMARLKALVDPDHLLNPGVILNSDARAHLRDLKPMPAVEEEVDRCIECGYCEPRCPSRDLTTTPRQRIVLRREIVRLAATGEDPARLAALEADFPYMALDTCAVDGLCATACPVGIDTGQLTKRFRAAGHGPRARTIARWCAEHMALVEAAARLGLGAAHGAAAVLGHARITRLSRAMRGLTGLSLPVWNRHMPRRSRAGRVPRGRNGATPLDAAAVYFPTCITRVMGPLPGEPDAAPLPEALTATAARAGVRLHVADSRGTCCGVAFSSKGYVEAHAVAVNRAIERMWHWTREGRLPVVCDTSPCTFGLLTARPVLSAENQARFDRLRILDAVEFVHDLLPRLRVTPRTGLSVIHPVCSLVKMGLVPKLEVVVRACSEAALVPDNAGCCGFAGDRGLTFPELTAAATRTEAQEVAAAPASGHYSSSRTCELGLTSATGRIYRSFLHLVEEATRG